MMQLIGAFVSGVAVGFATLYLVAMLMGYLNR